MLPSTIIGWIVLILVVMFFWHHSAEAGAFVFQTVPDHVSAFFSAA